MKLYLFERGASYCEHRGMLVAADDKAEAIELATIYEMEYNGGYCGEMKREECADWHAADCEIVGEASSGVEKGVLMGSYRHG